ncbi:MAG TPA: BamA/TamA family outer membrane protein [Gemmatimonadaceae bacterium]|nr:BamA/TamA family outer membrane protein [Gemmatimonadaceae bacterium]
MPFIPLHRLVLAGAIALASAGITVSSEAQRSPVEQEHPEVKDLVFDGAASIDQSELKRNIATSESSCTNLLAEIFFCWYSHAPAFYQRAYLDREEMKADMLRIRVFYFKRGWRDAVVDTSVTPNGDGVTVTFHIDEGKPTRLNRVQVLYDSTVLDDRRVRRLVHPRAGDNLNLLSVDTARVLLEQELWNRGYPDGTVDTSTVVDTARKLADLTLRATPNRRATVGTITIRGTDKVAPQTIVNSMTLRTGEIFRRSDVLLSQRNLYESNLFRSALVTVPPQLDTVKDIEVEVLEAPVREAHVGGGFNTIDYFQLQGRFTHYNILGGARRLDLTGAVGNLLASSMNGAGIFRRIESDNPAYLQPTYQLSVDFKQPAFLQRPENAVGVGAFYNRRAAPDVYIERTWGGLATYTRNLAVRDQASASYRFEVSRIEASEVYFCVNYGVCDTTTINTLNQRQRMTPISASYLRDKSNEPFTPTAGYVLRGEAEHASAATGSEFRHNRVFADAAYYFRVGQSRAKGWASTSVSPAVTNTVLAVHLRMGGVKALAAGGGTGVLHPRKRFYAGGAQSVRGYAENQLGPRILTVAPERLAAAQSLPGGVCDAATENIRYCDPNSPDTLNLDNKLIGDEHFIPRPLGGTSLIEGSVELRFPVWKKLTGAAFIDAGAVGEASVESFADLADLGRLTRGTWAVTPGVGARYHTRVGPIRVDIGYNPGRPESLLVVTELCEQWSADPEPKCLARRIVPLEQPRVYDPVTRWYQRMTLHLSIGQAY